MSNIYLFDVDGTLTPAKSKIDPQFANTFIQWMENREVYIVSGGSFDRIIDQLGTDIVNKTAGVFACMGNIFYEKFESADPGCFSEWNIIYENSFVAPGGFYKKLNKIVEKSPYQTKTGRHYEERAGMVNFSIVGRNADKQQRAEYAEYDAERSERIEIVEKLKEKYPKIDFVIGGAVSIDIFNKGNDKSQVVERYFKESLEGNRIHFVGDRIAAPGNDHALATRLRAHSNGAAYEVESWQDTAKLLKTPPFTS